MLKLFLNFTTIEVPFIFSVKFWVKIVHVLDQKLCKSCSWFYDHLFCFFDMSKKMLKRKKKRVQNFLLSVILLLLVSSCPSQIHKKNPLTVFVIARKTFLFFMGISGMPLFHNSYSYVVSNIKEKWTEFSKIGARQRFSHTQKESTEELSKTTLIWQSFFNIGIIQKQA